MNVSKRKILFIGFKGIFNYLSKKFKYTNNYINTNKNHNDCWEICLINIFAILLYPIFILIIILIYIFILFDYNLAYYFFDKKIIIPAKQNKTR